MEMFTELAELSLFKFNYYDRQGFIFAKRAIDILFSFLLIILTLPLQILIASFIVLSSKGPILFVQKRVGKDGKEFTMYKFRTMYKCDSKSSVINSDTGTLLKIKSDSRVTPIGKFLRKSSLDEIPQFYNVLFGSMSMVGPRPLLENMLNPYKSYKELRSTVKPGITGLWQISNRENCRSLLDMIDYDLQYISDAGISTDFKIILATIWVVIIGKGAY